MHWKRHAPKEGVPPTLKSTSFGVRYEGNCEAARTLISSLQPPHPGAGRLDNPHLLSELSYWLSLHECDGFDCKRKEFLNLAQDRWPGFRAELGGIWLLGLRLDLRILGFEQKSPRASRKDSSCDVVAKYGNELLYFEIKQNCYEESQSPADWLRDKLASIPYGPLPQVKAKALKPGDAERDFQKLKEHIRNFERKTGQQAQPDPRPTPYFGSFLDVYFVPGEGKGGHHFEPAGDGDLESWLLDAGRTGRNGKPMKPMVGEADDKGADYLTASLPFWGRTGEDIARSIFRNVTDAEDCLWTDDCRVPPSLRGIILFDDSHSDFCIVNNSKHPGPHLRAKRPEMA